MKRIEIIVAVITLAGTISVPFIEKLISSSSNQNNSPSPEKNLPERNLSDKNTQSQNLSFFCNESYQTPEGGNVPATIIRSSSKPDVPMFFWKDTSWGKKWSPQARCQEVSRRLQISYDNGVIKHIFPGRLNNYPTLCVSKEMNERCNDNNLLITLKSGENASNVLQEIIAFRHYGGVTVYRDSGSYMNVFEYWQNAPTINNIPSEPRF